MPCWKWRIFMCISLGLYLRCNCWRLLGVCPLIKVVTTGMLNALLIILLFMSYRDKRVERENKLLLKELPYYGCKDLASAHLQFNNLLTSALSGNQLDKLKSLFDLDLFYLNVPTDQQVKVSSNHSHFRCNYFSPQNFLRQKHRLAQSDNFVSIFYNNIWSLSKTLENLQNYLLNEFDTHFSIIGVSETRIVKDRVLLFNQIYLATILTVYQPLYQLQVLGFT